MDIYRDGWKIRFAIHPPWLALSGQSTTLAAGFAKTASIN